MLSNKRLTGLALMGLLLGSGSRAGAAATTFAVVESKSSVRIHVGKSGAFSFAGHKHEVEAPVSGTVVADGANLPGSSVALTFAASRMRVLPEGEPKGDAPKVEEAMRGPKVLDVARFSEITFKSKKITGRATTGSGYDLAVVGELSLHGVTREITVPLKVTVEGRLLTAVGEATLLQDQFGMERVSAAGGTVKVKNEVGISFQIVAEQR